MGLSESKASTELVSHENGKENEKQKQSQQNVFSHGGSIANSSPRAGTVLPHPYTVMSLVWWGGSMDLRIGSSVHSVANYSNTQYFIGREHTLCSREAVVNMAVYSG